MGALDDLQTDADLEAADHIELTVGDLTVRAIAVSEWPSSALRDLANGDFETWAEKVLVIDDDRDDYTAWIEYEPKIREVEEMMVDLERQLGASRGKSRSSRRSSTRTRRS